MFHAIVSRDKLQNLAFPCVDPWSNFWNNAYKFIALVYKALRSGRLEIWVFSDFSNFAKLHGVVFDSPRLHHEKAPFSGLYCFT